MATKHSLTDSWQSVPEMLETLRDVDGLAAQLHSAEWRAAVLAGERKMSEDMPAYEAISSRDQARLRAMARRIQGIVIPPVSLLVEGRKRPDVAGAVARVR